MTTDNVTDGTGSTGLRSTRARLSRWGRTYDLSALLGLTRELTALLVPVRPRPEFRSQLHKSLIAAARQQQAQRALALGSASAGGPDRLPGWFRQGDGRLDRRWVIGVAAVGSAVSMAGAVVAIVLRQRGRDNAAA